MNLAITLARLRQFRLWPGVLLWVRLQDLFWLLLCTALLLVVLIWSASTGSYALSPEQVWQILLAPQHQTDRLTLVVWEFRLPRILAAVLCGAALAIAGVLLQSLTRNVLASPGLLGVEAGARITLLICLVLLPDQSADFWLPVSGMIGGFLVAGLIYLLASVQGYSSARLILVGIGVTAMLSALSEMLITYGDIERVESVLMWLGGSLHQIAWGQVEAMVWWLLLAGVPALLCFRQLNLLRLGDKVALSRGVDNPRVIPLLLLISVALTAAAVATAGTMTFAGLVAPHIARRLCGDRHGVLLPLASLLGALLVLLGDTLGRTLLAPLQLPAGLVIALIGAPLLGVLIRRNRV